MITFDAAAALVHQQASSGPTIQQCADALSAGSVRPLTQDPGHDTARGFQVIFGIRASIATQAGRTVPGLAPVLERLATYPDDDQVSVFHFANSDTIFSVFVHESSRQVAGCIVLPRRTPPESPP